MAAVVSRVAKFIADTPDDQLKYKFFFSYKNILFCSLCKIFCEIVMKNVGCDVWKGISERGRR